MNKILTTAIAACGFIAAASAPLTAEAATSVFSGKDATVYAEGYDGNLYLFVNAFENASKSKSVKATSSGAYAYGYDYDGTYYYYFYGDTTTIQFKATGKIPNKVIASGSIPVTGSLCEVNFPYYCYPYSDTVTFNVNADALGDQAYHNWGTTHYENGPFKQNNHFDYSSAPAAFNDSFITSSRGTVNPTWGSVGDSKFHDVDITK